MSELDALRARVDALEQQVIDLTVGPALLMDRLINLLHRTGHVSAEEALSAFLPDGGEELLLGSERLPHQMLLALLEGIRATIADENRKSGR